MSNHDNSFADFSPAVQWVATVFMLLGAMSFSRFVQFARGEPRALLQDSQIRAFLAIYLCLAVALLAARLLAQAPLGLDTLREVLFNLASVITTTGFASTDYSLWGPLAETIFFAAMMICGCSGSTSGGPKVFRYQLLLGAVHGEVRRLHSPSIVFTPRFQGVAVTDDVMDSVIAFFMLFFLTMGVGAIALVTARARPGQRHHRRRGVAHQRRPRPRPGDRPRRHLRAAARRRQVGLLVPDAGRAAGDHDRLRAAHRRVLARLRQRHARPPSRRLHPRLARRCCSA